MNLFEKSVRLINGLKESAPVLVEKIQRRALTLI